MSSDDDSAHHPPPPRPSLRALFFGVSGFGTRWPAAVRAAAAFALPAVVLLIGGLGHNALFAALGSFAVLYGENRPFRIRWRVIGIASAALVASVAVMGSLGHLADLDASVAVRSGLVMASVVIAGVAVFVGNALRIGPPGPLFFVLTGGISATVTQHGVNPWVVVACTAAGTVGSMVAGMAPALVHRSRPEESSVSAAVAAIDDYLATDAPPESALRQGASGQLLHAWSVLHDAAQTDGVLAQRLWQSHHRLHGATEEDETLSTAPLPRPSVGQRLRAAAHPNSHATVATVRVVVAATVVGLVSVAVGLSRPDWAIAAVVLVLQLGPDRIRGVLRGAHRLAGTVVGVGLFAVVHLLEPGSVALVAILTVLTFTIEISVVSNYGLAVLAITPLALLMSPTTAGLAVIAGDRIIETALGVAVAVAALWVVSPGAHRRTTRWSRSAAVGNMRRLLDDVAVTSPHTDAARAGRRDVQWALMEAELAATESAVDEPRWAHTDWPSHVHLRHLGHDLLAACWTAPRDRPLGADVVSDLRARAAAVG
ncbi:FUSC family protein [Williamsia herbipolensis]|uniref:FUSC family protein n=1 Tax=Williamsia herbipolensis TaxID=1603258 RepID=UPI0005F876E3|nr:FUSC family protein [Williamsia herbipolensis]